ncbi:hypothetical protein [Nocardia sp. NBC_01329]|uniref:hypothetical protein n=1 Tax=Nocardia sp. NBC_01329 TaxID=2903594 RepID=UPI002E0E2A20|nr:hypothetical protein OG405_27425 [Nocardia sp. NBC_01329]
MSLKQVRAEQQGTVCDEAVPGGDDYQWQDTPEDFARFQQLYDPDPVLPEGPVAMLPIAQLYVRDVPGLRPPAGKDLLQVLWCPFEHDDLLLPTTTVVWRSTATVTDILADPPELVVVQHDGRFVPVPCTISPELVTEYPAAPELDKDVYQQLKLWEAGYLGIDVEDLGDTESPYQQDLSVAPGWKIGGYVGWGRNDPWVQPCPTCGRPTEPVLTLASSEWDGGQHSWVPYEDQPADMSRYGSGEPTKIQIHDMWDLVIGACPASPEHPHVLFPGS